MGENCGHGSHQCKILISHASKVRGQHHAAHPSQKHPFKKSSSTKPWQKGSFSNDNRTYSQKEVQMLLQRQRESQSEVQVIEKPKGKNSNESNQEVSNEEIDMELERILNE